MSSKPQVLIKAFPVEVAAAFGDTARELGLGGPVFDELVLRSATYSGEGVSYKIMLDLREHGVETRSSMEDGKFTLIADVERVASAAGVAGQACRVSGSASSLYALRGSLQGQARCLRLVHPILSGPDGLAVMRSAGARELWADDDA